MGIELSCQGCGARLAALADTPEAEIVRRMTEEGPWYGLGDGALFRDMVTTALRRRGRIGCPECGEALRVLARDADEFHCLA
jgi:hypothetical protein